MLFVLGRLWHRLDDRYCLPKASLTLLFRNAAVQHSWDADNATWSFDANRGVQSGILMDMFSDALSQNTYGASLAGLHWSFTKSASGLVLMCDGYSEHLAHFALNIVNQFFTKQTTFLQEKYLKTNKDKTVRYLESYLNSKRADNYATYYTNMLLSSRGFGVEDSLSLTRSASLKSVELHHECITSLDSTKVDCLISGNISRKDAEHFFSKTREIVKKSKARCKESKNLDIRNKKEFYQWIPGPFGRKLEKSTDIHLHFQSRNPEDQNGAVRITFQSQTPGFKGLDVDLSSTKESLTHTAAIRALCHLLREPLFNKLRTKEQLGYVVNSYFDVDFSQTCCDSDKMQGDLKFFSTTKCRYPVRDRFGSFKSVITNCSIT